MTTLRDLLAAVAAESVLSPARLVLADWLEEHGDGRADRVRGWQVGQEAAIERPTRHLLTGYLISLRNLPSGQYVISLIANDGVELDRHSCDGGSSYLQDSAHHLTYTNTPRGVSISPEIEPGAGGAAALFFWTAPGGGVPARYTTRMTIDREVFLTSSLRRLLTLFPECEGMLEKAASLPPPDVPAGSSSDDALFVPRHYPDRSR